MRKCANCGKGSIIVGKRQLLRGHYNPVSRSRKYPNLQKFRLPNGKRILACAKCIKNAKFKTEVGLTLNGTRAIV